MSPELAALRKEVAAAGYNGEKVVFPGAADVQHQAFEDAPCMPLGVYCKPVAYRSDLAGMMQGLIRFTGVKRA